MTYAQPVADPTNVVGRRIGAYVIDVVLMAVLSLAIIYPMFDSAAKTAPSSEVECDSGSDLDDDSFDSSPSFRTEIRSSVCFEVGDEVRYIPDGESGSFIATSYGIGFGFQILNLVLLQGLTGASVGKLVLGLRVIRKDGRTANVGWAALRWLVLLVDAFCCVLPGLLLVFLTKGHRRLGDMAAGTFVVRKESVGTAPQVPGVTSPDAWPVVPQQGYGAAPGGWPAGPSAPGGPGAAGGWSAPPSTGQQGTWAPGGTGTPPAPGTTPTGEGPTWDAARNAYIQYDRDRSAWVQWDDATKAWRPIDQ